MTPKQLRSAIKQKYPDMTQTAAIEAVAGLLGVSPRTVYRWLSSTLRPMIPLKLKHLESGVNLRRIVE